MKKIFTILLSAFATLPMVAQLPAQSEIAVPVSNMNFVSKTGKTYEPAFSKQDKLRLPLGGNSETGLAKAPQSNMPEGEKSYYTIDMDLLNFDGTPELSNETGAATILVKQEDNKVSLLCPFNYYTGRESTFIEGVLEGNKMKFNLPVAVDVIPAFTMVLSMHRYDKEAHEYLPIEDPEENVLEIEVGEDGKLTINTSDIEYSSVNIEDENTYPEIILGVSAYATSDNTRLGFVWGTWHTVFNPISLNTAPEGIVFEEWSLGMEDPSMKYSIPGWNRIAGVAIDGNDIYIKGISEYSEDSIIKGTIEDGVATFSGIQAAGFCPKIDLICYFVATEAELNGTTIEIGEDTSLKMVMDMEKKTLKSNNVIMWCVIDPITRSYMNSWFNPMCIANVPENLNASLETSLCNGGSNMSGSGMGYLLVNYIPNINVNGCVLDKSKMYYNLYLNGELYTFKKDEYFTLTEDLTNIPADYSDNFYFTYQMTMGVEIYGIWCWYYTSELYTVGLQSFYEGSDGVLYKSELSEVNPGFYSSVKDVQSDNVSPISEEFYTVDGMKVTTPTDGIYIKVSKMSDGTRKVEKFMK